MTTEIERFLQRLPRYDVAFCIEHNYHKTVYQSAEDAAEEVDFWVSEEDKRLAIELDSIWCVYYYPDTPVGFHRAASYSLENCLEYLND